MTATPGDPAVTWDGVDDLAGRTADRCPGGALRISGP